MSLNKTMAHQCVQVKVMIILIYLYLETVKCQTYTYDYAYSPNTKQYTRKITLKQGVLQGVVVGPRVNHALSHVEQYLGIPYAAAPVGDLRFMAPSSAPVWFGVKYADSFGPVCPQRLPDVKHMEQSRKEYFQRLVQHLINQSEDCLYLNIYTPVHDPRSIRKLPVLVFLHGESFEWNAGNPYDGSILAAYGRVIVVTLNFRLGILGFLKVGLDATSSSNFGLLDQVAALLWVRENIVSFGGDPDSVTLMGHGTGAVCASLLMLSPMIVPEVNKPLFRRAILMSGSSLTDWALAGSPRHVTYQVAETLNCPTENQKFASCLRKKRLSEIMSASVSTAPFVTVYGPIVDGIAVLNDPKKSMIKYNDMFKRFEILYGVTEIESIHLLGPVALTHGLLEQERDQELGKYLHNRCEIKRELCVARTLSEYMATGDFTLNDEMYGGVPVSTKAINARDALLEILSDARTAAPVAQMAKYHAILNPQSYFYVFGHTTASRDFIRNKSVYGEELPYIFGVPLDGPRFHFVDHYTAREKLFSEVVMTFWCNFAANGNPNVPRKSDYMNLNRRDWLDFEVDWPEFDLKTEPYIYLGIPPRVEHQYRNKELNYWNDVLPELLRNHSIDDIPYRKPTIHVLPEPPYQPSLTPKNVPFWLLPKPSSKATISDKFPFYQKQPEKDPGYGVLKLKPDGTSMADNTMSNEKTYGTLITSPPSDTKSGSTTMHILIIVGGAFLVVNLLLFIALYYKCTRLKKRPTLTNRIYEDRIDNIDEDEKTPKLDGDITQNGCGIMQMISRSTKSEDTYEAVKVSGESSSTKYKLSRQLSASTIDPHTKVRDWIVQKCSPQFLRRPQNTVYERRNNSPLAQPNNQVVGNHIRSDSKTTQGTSTLGRSPTRPVSPTNTSNSEVRSKKTDKVSVAVDATPAGRGPSVLRQQPIEVTKSLDFPNYVNEDDIIRRSATLDNFLDRTLVHSTSSINLECPPVDSEPVVIKIEHCKSKSEPVSDDFPIYAQSAKKLTTFDPTIDVNVTSKADNEDLPELLSPEEALLTIKRRNYPKVLPKFPDGINRKRLSMPVGCSLYVDGGSQPNSPTGKLSCRFPPQPPPRGSSTLGRKSYTLPIIQSAAVLAEEPPEAEEPELACNNLYVGPLVPKDRRLMESCNDDFRINSQPIYDNLRSKSEDHIDTKVTIKQPTTIITTDVVNPIKKVEPKYIVKPTINKFASERNKSIPRVFMKDIPSARSFDRCDGEIDIPKTDSVLNGDNFIEVYQDNQLEDVTARNNKVKTPSLIPKLVKNNALNKESSSESSPSEESETGTVINKV